MRHWHALSHLLHFVRHEGRLATIGRTRVTRWHALQTSSSSYSVMSPGWSLALVHLVGSG